MENLKIVLEVTFEDLNKIFNSFSSYYNIFEIKNILIINVHFSFSTRKKNTLE